MEASRQKLQITMMEMADMAHSLAVTGFRKAFRDVVSVYSHLPVRSKREKLKRLTTKSSRFPPQEFFSVQNKLLGMIKTRAGHRQRDGEPPKKVRVPLRA